MKLIFAFTLLISSLAVAQKSTPYWMSMKYRSSVAGILNNINPDGNEPGTVVASPSVSKPPYYFHWVRDSALVMNNVIDLYLLDTQHDHRQKWQKLLIDYALRARTHQKSTAGLGEPKFNLDGTAFAGPWGRPQYDGPALRAAVFSRLARIWLREGKHELVHRFLWDPKRPDDSLIRADLEFISQVWDKPSFDIWEESVGLHFFTALVQRKALLIGGKLAQALGQFGDSLRYYGDYQALTSAMEAFWSPSRGYYLASIEKTGGVDYKHSNLDSSLFIAANFSEFVDDNVGAIDDPRLLRNFVVLEKVFTELYPINRSRKLPAMIGRYPEDKYDGVGSSIGNPWFLTTHAFAEYLYKLSTYLGVKGKIEVSAVNSDFYKQFDESVVVGETLKSEDKRFAKLLLAIFQRADGYLIRAQYHTGSSFQMSEQINRYSGYQQGARDLTWSYASFVSAYFARHRVDKRMFKN